MKTRVGTLIIPLTQGQLTAVDSEDFEFLSRFNWAYVDRGYARRTIRIDGVKRNERMHRVVMGRVLGRELLQSEQVDHINRDRLDNRRSNLRLATNQTNAYNSFRQNSLGFRGVYQNHHRYMASIKAEVGKFYIGTFDSPEEAAWMRDQWAIELHGEFATLNFDYK